MTLLDDIKLDLISNVKFQATPIPFDSIDYDIFVLNGVKRLYIDEGIEDKFIEDYDKVSNTLARTFTLTESKYATISSEIAFRTQIKDDLSQIIGYSTNAISITGANTPYKNLNEIVQTLESRLSVLAFKFTHKKV